MNQPDPQAPKFSTTFELAVVGIGASAGGLAALRTFFAHVPEDSGLAFVIVVHLAPDQESHLAELLQPQIKMPVQQVTQTLPLEANHVYVIPPNANLNTIDTHLRLSELEEKRQERAPIDHFFRTLARTHDGRAIGVILSGTGSDGALGLKEIKEKGGLTVVQEPAEAEYDGMPRSAIATGLVDLILPLAEMPEAILRFVRTEPRLVVSEDGRDLATDERQLLQKIFIQLRTRTGRDFSRYKHSTIIRRLARRMQLAHIEELTDYLHYLRAHPEEVWALADDLLVTVTNFFRDPAVFQKLEEEVIPRLLERKEVDEEVRVWSVGCATGEEAYSLAILLLEAAVRHDVPPRIQIFASDLHEPSLAKAREGFYPGDIERDVSAARLRRFFHKESGGYRIRKEVRELVIFTAHNLLGDPPFSRLDLIACRNVFIYLQRDIQNEVIELFHYALRTDGWLVLGASEIIEDSNLFRTADKQACLYQKRKVPRPEPRLPVFPLPQMRSLNELAVSRPTEKPMATSGVLHQRLVERYAPPSLLVSPDYKVIHLSEHAGRYLVHPGGELTANIFKLVREELRLELEAALHIAQEQRKAIHSKPIAVRFNGETGQVVLHVRPALESEEEGFALVIFDEWESAELVSSTGRTDARPDAIPGHPVRLRELEAELDVSRQRLHTIIEKYETSQAEMRAANEELQSANEELRSTMEELETSKEELQSMNEELQTIAQENRHKVEELAQLSSDLQNLLVATEIATLFLDRELRIMRFTPQVGQLFNMRLVDRGRPLSDLTHRLGYNDLTTDAEQVLKQLTPIEREVTDDAGQWYLARVLPYRGATDRIEGVVITFIDITQRKRAESALRESEERFRLMANAVPQIIWITDPKGQVEFFNQQWTVYTGLSYEPTTMVKLAASVVHPDDVAITVERFDEAHRSGSTLQVEHRIRSAAGEYRWFLVRGAPFHDPNDGRIRHWFGISVDIHDRKLAEAERERLLAELQRINAELQQFCYIVSHDLNEPLRTMHLYVQLLAQRMAGKLDAETEQEMAFVTDAAQRMQQMLADLLAYTHAGSTLQFTRVDCEAVLTHVLAGLEAQIVERGAVITHDPLPTVEGDAARLGQVLQNLIDNALKFCEEQPPRIHIAAVKEDQHWRLSVRDNGIGIAPQRMERLFQIFQRLHTREEYAGSGIGLAICRKIVEQHGGRIWVESQPGAGSTFYFTISDHKGR